MALWAKQRSSHPTQTGYHPLLYHLLDVTATALALWDHVLTPIEREDIAQRLHLSISDARLWVTFLAGSHDVGKASPVFQLQIPSAADRLADAGVPTTHPLGRAPHGFVSTQALFPFLEQHGTDSTSARLLADAVGGHHGVIPSAHTLIHMSGEAVGLHPWTALRSALLTELARIVGLPAVPPVADDTVALWLAGFVSVADWIGSNQTFFRFAAPDQSSTPPQDTNYFEQAVASARNALHALGWLASAPDSLTGSWADMFNWRPNAMQRTVIEIAPTFDRPGIVLIESPTGSGKTEAALWLANTWAQTLGHRGFYVALPTQATSDQMFDRVTAFLQKHASEAVNVQLLHGHAALNTAFQALRRDGYRIFQPYGVGDPDDPLAAVAAAEWFTFRKRGLLAPIGIGTVDQALLAVLQTRHVFVRLFGLSHRTIIIDEVHAYDVYMSTLLHRLLTWLAALGSSVILLSATLPDSRRRDLIAAYASGTSSSVTTPFAPYPRITWFTPTQPPGTLSIDLENNAPPIMLRWLPPLSDGAPHSLPALLTNLLCAGGTVAVICNTVASAQKVYLNLKPHFSALAEDDSPELDLLHSRFLYHERATREQRTLRRFGKSGPRTHRPHRAILVSTQIIEQSLDIDFDAMVTELAPIDLLLQRAGRLHRHIRTDRPIVDRSLWVAAQQPSRETIPALDQGSSYIYFPHILFRTWLALRGLHQIAVPEDVQTLIEAVYDDDCLPDLSAEQQAFWDATRTLMIQTRLHEEAAARKRHIWPPGATEELADIVGLALEEDAPALHPALQAVTRLAEPSVSVVILPHDWSGNVSASTVEEAAALLEHSVTLSNRSIYRDLQAMEPPASWQRSPLLRHSRLLRLSPAGTADIGTYILTLHPELGVVIEKKGEPDAPI